MDPLSFANRVFALCFKHQGSVSSWGRTLKHNKDVGGVVDSYHMLWLGCDVVLDAMFKNQEFEDDAGELGLKAILEGDHYHLQPLKMGAS
jgi:hypothetical protein